MIYTIKNDKLTATVSSKGSELISVKSADGKEFIWQADEKFWARSAPVLFPIVGGLKDKKCIRYFGSFSA